MVHLNPFKKSVCGKPTNPFEKRFTKRGQTEMIGLVIVVILIVIGALFYLKFVVLGGKEQQQHKADSLSSTQAYNLMNAVMNIKLCGNISVMEGIKLCKDEGNICEYTACSYMDDEVDKIVKSVIYKDYSLNVTSSGWHYTLGACKYGITSYPYLYTIKGETYKATFKIC